MSEYIDGRDEFGDRPREQHHELPAGDMDKIAAARLAPSDPHTLAAIGQAWSADVFAEQHADCEAPWECLGCDRLVCPRCDPSPNEPELCASCYWIADPNGGDAA